MTEQNQFDVFLAHNSADKPQVRIIANKLKELGLKTWIDEERIAAGELFQVVIQRAFPQIKSAAIFIGLTGLGKWQLVELQALISQFVDRGIPVIPVLLPRVDKIPDELFFLKQFNWVSFDDVEDDYALFKLQCGINGCTISEYLQNLQNKLADFTLQKDILEQEIKKITKRLNSIENHVKPNLRTLLTWLSQKEDFKKCGDAALKNFPSLEKEVIKSKNKLDRFHREINYYLEFLCASMETDSMIFLDEPPLEPSLANPKMYKFSCFDVYKETFEIIKNRVPSHIEVSVNTKFKEHIDYMITRFKFISCNY